MAVAASSRPRISVDGKFFRLGEKKFHVKGLAYGPFAPNAAGLPYAPPEETAVDFARIREANANLLRVYHPPAKWFLDLAAEHKLKVLVDIPWNKHLCFLDSRDDQARAREAVRRAVYACARHPSVFGFSVANEIPPDIVRWSGARAVADFIDELVHVAREVDPECLCTFTNYPPTEFLRPESLDFVCFVHRIRATGENDALRIKVADERLRNIVRMQFAIDLLFAHTAGNELGDLRTKVKDEDFLVGHYGTLNE